MLAYVSEGFSCRLAFVRLKMATQDLSIYRGPRPIFRDHYFANKIRCVAGSTLHPSLGSCPFLPGVYTVSATSSTAVVHSTGKHKSKKLLQITRHMHWTLMYVFVVHSATTECNNGNLGSCVLCAHAAPNGRWRQKRCFSRSWWKLLYGKREGKSSNDAG